MVTGYPLTMDDAPQDTRLLRRILVTTGLVLAMLLVAVAIVYAAAYIILAPMMQ